MALVMVRAWRALVMHGAGLVGLSQKLSMLVGPGVGLAGLSHAWRASSPCQLMVAY